MLGDAISLHRGETEEMVQREMEEIGKCQDGENVAAPLAFPDDNGLTIVRLSATDSAPNSRVEVMECSRKCVEIQFWTPLGH